MAELEKKLCGIAGEEGEPLTVGRFNKWFAIYVRLHVAPTHEKMTKIRNAQIAEHSRFETFMVLDKESHARIDGGIKTLKWMIPIFSALLGALLALILFLANGVYDKVEAGILPVAKERVERNQEAIRENKQRLERLERTK